MAGKRKKIGIRFLLHKDWTGGEYYLLNLVNALEFLPDDEKPEVIIYCNSEDEGHIRKNIKYSRFRFFFLNNKLSLAQRLVNKFSGMVSGKHVYSLFPKKASVDFVFPNPENYYFKEVNRIFWIPDFQEDHLPLFFSEDEIKKRKEAQNNLAAEARYIVFSSESAKKDFERLYPQSSAAVNVLNFAVVHPDYSRLVFSELRKKYNLPEDFFFCPNQFWRHKNHITVIKAVERLRKSGKEMVVVFSGKEQDYRNPDYTDQLKKYVSEHGLTGNIRFLGFIDRKDQLALMNFSKGIIQPSLFEGWSTVIEDAKAMGQLVIASDLDVHKEQLCGWDGNFHFFERENEEDLADQLLLVAEGKIGRKKTDYTPQLKKFASGLINLSHSITQ